MKKTLNSYTDEFKKNKILIINYWAENDNVKKILNDKKVNKDLFLKRYAFAILEHYIQMIEKQKIIIEYQEVNDFLKYLKRKDIQADELFILYFTFKNSLINFLTTINLLNLEISSEIELLFQKNFEIILKQYTKTIKDVEKALSKSIDIVDKNIIMSRTDLEGTILKVSSAFCEVSGYTANELIGQSHNIIRHPDMQAKVFEDMWQTIQSGKDWKGELKNRKKNGDSYWVETTIHPNLDNIGKIISYDAIRVDITSKKELLNQQNILVAQSKSAAMGEMISMIAHQWRQPLQAVSILIQKLPITKMIEGEITDELLDSVVDEIGSQLDYMSSTIDDFRDYFKPNRKKQTVFIDHVIKKAIEFLAYMIKVDSIELRINTDYNCKATIYLNEVVQVLINIIKNSRDAMIDHFVEHRVIKINTLFDDKNVYITIEDNAGGIPKHIIHKIFEPYFSTKSNKNGTGLGLYMSKTIVEQHSDGKLSVCNSDVGAKFTISLPLE